MSETGEGNPAGNFQKTVMAQKERTESVEKPNGLIDKLTGKYTFGHVSSEYKAGGGGRVETRIISGKAALDQNWRFDKDGNLESVWVSKTYDGKEAGLVSLRRDENGKFQVSESKSQNPGAWEKEFNTASRRIQANRHIPSSPKAPQPQK